MNKHIHMLVQLQLSNYTLEGKFYLTGDSNWRLFVTKASYMIQCNANMSFVVIVPERDQCIEDLEKELSDAGLSDYVKLVHTPIVPNAVVTRFDFSWTAFRSLFSQRELQEFTHVYVNDPMQLRHFKALFYIAKAQPVFILQTHFLDSPISKIVDNEVSYWHGTVEACIKADKCIWHCRSMLELFEQALNVDYQAHVISTIIDKSMIWKSGYSIAEIRKDVLCENLRFDPKDLDGKVVVWVPNRIGGLGKSFDYTNNGKFLFDIVPELWKQRQDFVVIAGNPNQKISCDEISERCPAYKKIVSGPLTRDEYRWLSSRADIVVGLYVNDTNGGLASLEAIEHTAIPLFPDVYEYKTYFDAVNWPSNLRVKPDLSNTTTVLSRLLDQRTKLVRSSRVTKLRNFIRHYAAYESITVLAMDKLDLL